jgi:hypothetical protein
VYEDVLNEAPLCQIFVFDWALEHWRLLPAAPFAPKTCVGVAEVPEGLVFATGAELFAYRVSTRTWTKTHEFEFQTRTVQRDGDRVVFGSRLAHQQNLALVAEATRPGFAVQARGPYVRLPVKNCGFTTLVVGTWGSPALSTTHAYLPWLNVMVALPELLASWSSPEAFLTSRSLLVWVGDRLWRYCSTGWSLLPHVPGFSCVLEQRNGNLVAGCAECAWLLPPGADQWQRLPMFGDHEFETRALFEVNFELYCLRGRTLFSLSGSFWTPRCSLERCDIDGHRLACSGVNT